MMMTLYAFALDDYVRAGKLDITVCRTGMACEAYGCDMLGDIKVDPLDVSGWMAGEDDALKYIYNWAVTSAQPMAREIGGLYANIHAGRYTHVPGL